MDPLDINDVELGAKYQDRITGAEGVCTGRLQYLNGCVQGLIEGAVQDDKKGDIPKGYWIDFDRLKLVKEAAAPAELRRTGGPGANEPAGSTREA